MTSRLAAIGFAVLLVLAATATAEEFARIGSDAGLFSRFPVDARGEAMGLATTVAPQGPTAFWWNPAPLPTGDDMSVSCTVGRHPLDEFDWRPLALRATWDQVTVGFMRARFGADDLVVRTAYDPDGSDTVDMHQDLYQLGASVDLMPWLTDGPTPWMWTVGANLRHYREALDDRAVSGTDLDLGASAAWTVRDDESGTLRLHATIMARNLSRATLDGYDDIREALPRYYHAGLAAELELGPRLRRSRTVHATLAFTARRDLEDLLPRHDSDNVGLEITLADIVSLRAGHRSSDIYGGDPWSWGFGLQHRVEAWRGLRVAIDYAAYDAESGVFSERLETWTVTAGMDWR